VLISDQTYLLFVSWNCCILDSRNDGKA